MRIAATIAGTTIVLAASLAMLRRSAPPPSSPVTSLSPLVAAPARVEGRQESIAVTAAMDGVLAEVLVHEGDRVSSRQIVARLECRDLEADLAAAEARLIETSALRRRLLRGGRDDARAEAAARIRSAEARLASAQLALERARQLFDGDQLIPRASLDDAERDEQVANSELEAARQHAAVVTGEPLPEEREAADATVAVARSSMGAIAARLDRCAVRSPIDGMVLRRHLQQGERVTGWSDLPIVTVGDLSSVRVRIEVDERDIGAVRLGQRVQLTAEALGTFRPSAVVSFLSPAMGRRHVQSGDPSEKADRDIMEVIADVADRDARLVSGLRVTAVFVAEP